MTRYFLDLIFDEFNNPTKFKVALFWTLFIILMANTRDNLLTIVYVLNGIYTSDQNYNKFYNIIEKVSNSLSFFNAILPYTIASFMLFTIRYFAQMSEEVQQSDDKDTTYKDTDSLGSQVLGSIYGADDQKDDAPVNTIAS